MKPNQNKIIWLTAFALAGGGFAGAQSNGVPGATDYAAFTQFVTERNIFDPNRQPHYVSTRPRIRTTRTRVSSSAPEFTLVGTMSYGKGLFAFFNGNNDDLKKALPVSEKIAGYTVTAIGQGHVTLESTNQPGKLDLKVGDVMRQENGRWELSGTGDLPAETSGATADPDASPDGASSTPAPSPALGQNEILKKLMQQREKENQ